MKKIFDMFRSESSRQKEVEEEQKLNKISLLENKTDKELLKEVNVRLEMVEKTLTNLVITLNELVKTQINTQEVIVQLATASEEMAYIFDSKSIMINIDPEMFGLVKGNGEPAEDVLSFPKDSASAATRKKMMN